MFMFVYVVMYIYIDRYIDIDRFIYVCMYVLLYIGLPLTPNLNSSPRTRKYFLCFFGYGCLG